MASLININCDLGEGCGNDHLIVPYIHSANIACGYHAGNADTMQETIELCVRHGVRVGAHPSYNDPENFGRTEMKLPADELYDLITQQLIIFNEAASRFNTEMHHVKPHGALYNQSAKDPGIAKLIARAIKDFDFNLVLYGLSGSHSISAAKQMGLKTASEVFADRTYQDDGSLTPRSKPGALIEDPAIAVQQVMEMVSEGFVTSVSGKRIKVDVDTICIHGDGKQAVEFAREFSNFFT